MVKVMFVCHGNICRSPMAEFVFRDMVEKKGLSHQIQVKSSATSQDAVGWPVHEATVQKLQEKGISCAGKVSVQLKKKDYDEYDYIVCMDERNLRNLKPIIGEDHAKKVRRLLDYTDTPGDIADPWYTHDFNVTYTDIVTGCTNLLAHILSTTLKQ